MAFYELHRLVMTKGNLKGLLHLKARRKVRECASTSSHMYSSCESHGDLGNVTNNLQREVDKFKFNEKYVEKNSIFLLVREVDEFIVVD